MNIFVLKLKALPSRLYLIYCLDSLFLRSVPLWPVNIRLLHSICSAASVKGPGHLSPSVSALRKVALPVYENICVQAPITPRGLNPFYNNSHTNIRVIKTQHKTKMNNEKASARLKCQSKGGFWLVPSEVYSVSLTAAEHSQRATPPWGPCFFEHFYIMELILIFVLN